MKRTLLTSVALGAMFAGAAFTNPAITDSIVSPAMAQQEPADGADTTTDQPEETLDDAADSVGDAADDAGDAASDAADDAGDAMDDTTDTGTDATSPATTPSDTTDTTTTPMDDADSAEDADDTLTDTDDAADTAAPMTDDSASTDAAPSGEMFVTMQEQNEVSANTYVGQSLYNMEDESIGQITDLIFSDDGGARTAVVGVGGFLGIGQKDVGVNFDMITIEQQPDSTDVRLVIEATREDLENAPEFMDLDDQMAEQEAQQAPVTDTGGAMAPAPAPAPAPAQ